MRERERAALERLSRVGGSALVSELVGLYLEDLPGRIARARGALSARDPGGLAKAAHALRSSSAQLGADALTSACDALEDAAERADLEEASVRVEEIEREAHSFSERLSAHVGVERPVTTDASLEPQRSPLDAARIAVIEDNADNRLLIDALLGDTYALEEYVTGAEALSSMKTRPPQLVLLDVSLPGMDGLAVLERMRAHPVLNRVPVIAVTAHAMMGDRERYLAAGFDGYVAKPIVDEDVLIDAVAELLANGRPPARSEPPTPDADP